MPHLLALRQGLHAWVDPVGLALDLAAQKSCQHRGGGRARGRDELGAKESAGAPLWD